MNTKRKGSRNEHRSIALLEGCGYLCTRVAASLGDWDIIAIGPVDIVLCQVKTRDWPGSVEMETVRNFMCPPNCRKIIRRWAPRKRLPDIRTVSKQENNDWLSFHLRPNAPNVVAQHESDLRCIVFRTEDAKTAVLSER